MSRAQALCFFGVGLLTCTVIILSFLRAPDKFLRQRLLVSWRNATGFGGVCDSSQHLCLPENSMAESGGYDDTTMTLTHTRRRADNFVIDYNDHQIWEKTRVLPEDEIIVTFQKPHNGARWRTPCQYEEGRFSVYMKTAAGLTDGIVSSFYVSSAGGPMDQIELVFLGKDKMHVQTNFWVDGNGGRERVLPLGFDASEAFHLYELDIRKDKITWLVDNRLIREEVRSKQSDRQFPQKPFYLYFSLWDGSWVADGEWAGKCTWQDQPYYFHFKKVTVQALAAEDCPFKPKPNKGLIARGCKRSSRQDPRSCSSLEAESNKGLKGQMTLTHSAKRADNFAIDYSSHQIWDKTAGLPRDEIVITYQRPYNGARWRTARHYGEGYFGAHIKMCAGRSDGIVGSFYTSSLEGPRDMHEIDFEFLGKNKTHIQTNFWVDGHGGREMSQPLGFDASQDFHHYAFDIREDRITWLVDGKVIRIEEESQHDKFPWKPFYLYASVWDGSLEENGEWAGKCTWEDEPYYIHYKQITVPLRVAEECQYKSEPYKCWTDLHGSWTGR